MSYTTFIEVFNINKGENNASLLFTNTCFKAKTPNTVEFRRTTEAVWDTFHICVQINGECPRGSLLTKFLLDAIEDGPPQEFDKFERKITDKLQELEEDDDNIYIHDVRYYGVRKCFYFFQPSDLQNA